MFMHIHKADLAAKECSAFGSLKERLNTAFVFGGAIHQTGAIRTFQVAFDKIEVDLSLFFCKYFADNAPIHRQYTVADMGQAVARVKQQTEPLIFLYQAVPCTYS